MNESSPFAESVYTAKIFGIIEDRPSFRPNDIIEFDDAVQILLKALGYYGLNTSKNSAGAWASKLGLMKGIDERNSKKATLAKLLFNALDVPIVNSVTSRVRLNTQRIRMTRFSAAAVLQREEAFIPRTASHALRGKEPPMTKQD